MSVGLTREPGVARRPGGRRAWRRPSLGHVAVALAAVLAFVANLAFLRANDDATTVVVAAREIAAGEMVGRGDLTTARMSGDPGVLATLATSLEGLEGRVARRTLMSGELIGVGDLLAEAAPGGLVAMSIPIDPAHASGGLIRAGDRVDVVDVDAEGRAHYVVSDVAVLAVSAERSGALATGGDRHVVLGLSREDVLAVAEAIADGRVDVVVTTGAAGG